MKNKHACRVIVKSGLSYFPKWGNPESLKITLIYMIVMDGPRLLIKGQARGRAGEEYIVKGCHYSQEVFTGGLRPPRCDTSRYIIVRFIRFALRSLAGFFSRALSATPSVLRFALRGKG